MNFIECHTCHFEFASHDGDDGRCPKCNTPYVRDRSEQEGSLNDAVIPISWANTSLSTEEFV